MYLPFTQLAEPDRRVRGRYESLGFDAEPDVFQADGSGGGSDTYQGYDGFNAFPCLNRGLFGASKARMVVDPSSSHVSSRFGLFQLIAE